ncbi:MAG: FMN-binding glutamate synthase family protein [Hydrogenovibrio sp.]
MRTTRTLFVTTSVVLSVAVIAASSAWPAAAYLWLLLLPFIALGSYDMLQKKHTILRLYPILGHIRFIFESIRPEIQQYFVENDTDGKPVCREFRSLIYQRAKGVIDTRPFGTVFDTNRIGYEWIKHSLKPQKISDVEGRVLVGGKHCSHPYKASHLNISAMSFGALSQHAIIALNRAAKMGGFYHNTGEGGLTDYHLQEGGDLVWQIGTGYFSCRTHDGAFDRTVFTEKAQHEAVKMIEVKLSQGAKPAHGGVLPADKVTPEIAKIRIVPEGQDVISPPTHTAFSTPVGLLQFVTELRQLSGGKPVGFKLCIGEPSEFIAICKAMIETGLAPDFITVDGAEGGTGAAPVEFTNSVGTPLREGLHLVHTCLVGFGLRDNIRIIASGKSFSAAHLLGLLALGADMVNSARGMMFALGCVQSRSCHNNTCPTGVATQDPSRYKHLDIDDKSQRVARYQASVIHNLKHLTAATGLTRPSDVSPKQILRRVSATENRSYADIFPALADGCLLQEGTVPAHLLEAWQAATPHQW